MNPLQALPEVRITIDGSELDAEDFQALSEVRVQQRLSLPTLCELTFSVPANALQHGSRFMPGGLMRVGIAGKQEPLFVGQITASEHCYLPDRTYALHVRGYDLLHQLRKRQSVRAHVQVTTCDLARELVADLGLTVQAAEPGPLWPQLIQHRQSDFALLQGSAEKCGLYLTVRENVLHLLTLQGYGDALPLALGESLLEARLEVNADAVCRSVTATGWDASRMTTYKGQAASARAGRTGARELTPARVGGSGKRELVDEDTLNESHATGLAQAELDTRTASEVTLWGIAEGDPRLRPGTPVEVSGVAEVVMGRYVLSMVTHTIDAQQGFLSEISSTPPLARVRARGSVSAPGVVTQIDDPESLGRVRVSLPTYGDVETDWIPVVSAGAGSKKGLMAFPDLGDSVLVLLAHEDPGQGVVLGGLYAQAKPPDVGIDGGAVRRYTLLTPGGQRVLLDDGRKTLRLENSEGSYCELGEGKMRLHAASDLEIEAPGQKIVIRGQRIDFERG